MAQPHDSHALVFATPPWNPPRTAGNVAPSPPANYGNVCAVFYLKTNPTFVIVSIGYLSGDEKLATRSATD